MRNLPTLLMLISITALNSCTKIIDIELDEEDRRLVVQAWFTTEAKTHEIRLTQSSSYFDTEPTPQVSGANVSITGGGDTFIFTEVQPGVYHSLPNAQAKLSTNYTLKIEYDGNTYVGSDYCDTVPLLDYMTPYPYYDDEGEFKGYDILIWTKELSGIGDYYAWRTKINGQFISDTLSDIDFGSDDYIGDGLYFEAWPIARVKVLNSGDTLRLEQHNISKATYDAFYAVMSETDWRGGIFDAPPANVPTNLSNNALGLFVVSAMTSFDFIVP